MDESELRQCAPNAKFITKAKAIGRKVEFRTVKGRNDRGWCHINDTGDACSEVVYGLVYDMSEEESVPDFNDFERCFLTVYGDDGKMYNCYTLRLVEPGVAMRIPDHSVKQILKGAAAWNLPSEYQAKLRKMCNEALPCPTSNSAHKDTD